MTAAQSTDLAITRTIRAPRDKVFAAFVQPDLLSRWFGQRGAAVTQAMLDVRVGGRYRISMRPRSGETYTVGGEYREVRAPERLVFTWRWEGEAMGAMGESLVTVTFAQHGDDTEVRVLHTGLPNAAARDAHAQGWNGGLSKLVDATNARGSAASVFVYGDPRSTYVRSARMALAEKGVAYTLEPCAPHSDTLAALHPFGRVPALRDGDFALFETTAIVRYVDEAFDGPSLVAGNLRTRALMEQWASAINAYMYDTMVRRYVLQYVFPRGAEGKPDRAVIDAAMKEMPKQLALLDDAYGARNTLAGDTVTLADLLLAPIVCYLAMFPEARAALADVPNVRRAHDWIAQRESFTATMPPR